MYQERTTGITEQFAGIVEDFNGQQARVAYWAQEGRIEQLEAFWAEGLSATTIAQRMGGITRSAVLGKVHRLKLQKRTKSVGIFYGNGKPRHKRKRKVGTTNMRGEVVQIRAPKLNDEPLPPEPPRPKKLFTLDSLTDSQCRFPYGDPKSGDFGFCGCKKMPGSSYCPGHHGKVWQGVPVRSKSAHIPEWRGKHRLDKHGSKYAGKAVAV